MSERSLTGQLVGMMSVAAGHWRRFLSPLTLVLAAAAVFVLLLVGVRTQWAPLESVDHDTASSLNSLIAGQSVAVAVVKAVTFLGSTGVLWVVILAATAVVGESVPSTPSSSMASGSS